MNQQFLLLLCIVGAVTMIAYFITRLIVGSSDGKLRDRLAAPKDQTAPRVVKAGGVKPLLERLGQAAAEPFLPKTREKQSSLRKQLGYAGYYSPKALRVVTGAKVIFLVGGLLSGYAIGAATGTMMLSLSLGGIVGYLSPAIWLKYSIKSNQKQLNYGLPDALDLLVICVEAGLTVDAALQRVGQELTLAHPAICRELGVTHMETRVGVTRTDALRNMGVRTDNEALKSLASMLAQAERFGTSIGQALRIHAEALRVARQNAAEELAAKASVKMSFPLVLFIFPATFIVLLGPIIVGLQNSGIM